MSKRSRNGEKIVRNKFDLVIKKEDELDFRQYAKKKGYDTDLFKQYATTHDIYFKTPSAFVKSILDDKPEYVSIEGASTSISSKRHKPSSLEKVIEKEPDNLPKLPGLDFLPLPYYPDKNPDDTDELDEGREFDYPDKDDSSEVHCSGEQPDDLYI